MTAGLLNRNFLHSQAKSIYKIQEKMDNFYAKNIK